MERTNGGADASLDGLRRAVETSEARFRNIIEKNADGVVVVDHRGTIRFINPAASHLLGRSRDEILGSTFGIPIVAEETTEIDIATSDGTVRIAELRVTQTEWEGTPSLLIALRDMSKHKWLEEELRLKAKELAEADHRKDEFLAMLAHELRNPLAPILNAVQIMRLQSNDKNLLEQMQNLVERQVRSMARLVDDLLDVSRITRGKIQLRKEPVVLATVVHRAVENTRPLFQSRGQDLVLSVPEEPIPLYADPLRLEQIITNLLNNASKYSDPKGTVWLHVETDKEQAVVRVRDHGMGIAPHMVDRVFELFAQADRSLDRSQGGLGIGLTLVRSLTHMHGGTVMCFSDGLGRGSEFVVHFPIELVRVNEEPVPAPEPAKGEKRPLRVLVIDDNVHAAESLSLIVKLWGHEPRTAHDGPTALETARAFRPEVALVDIGLPGMDGFTVASRLREILGQRDLLLMATTGYGREDDRNKSREAGFDEHLVKPLDLDFLESRLNHYSQDGAVEAQPTDSL